MKISITKQIGGVTYSFDITEDKDIDALAMAGFLASMPVKCGMTDCGSEDIHLAANKAQGYTFVKMICAQCSARAQLGQYKEGGFFWKGWEKYQPPQGTENKQA